MTRYKTAELEGALLDAAVAKANGWEQQAVNGIECWWSVEAKADWWRSTLDNAAARVEWFKPSQDWGDGGPIIDAARMSTEPKFVNGDWLGEWRAVCFAWSGEGVEHADETGPTLLIAAMRAYVASKLGDEVELP